MASTAIVAGGPCRNRTHDHLIKRSNFVGKLRTFVEFERCNLKVRAFPRTTWTTSFARYDHRDKVRIVGKEEFLEDLNRQALAIAKAVARESSALLAGNICNTNIYDPQDIDSHWHVRAMLEEQAGSTEVFHVRDVATDNRAFFGPSATVCRLLRDFGLLGLMMIRCTG